MTDPASLDPVAMLTADERDAYASTRAVPADFSPCHAPFSNMYFSASGWVAPCWIQIGECQERWSPDRSILEIFRGAEFDRLRSSLATALFPGACGRCADAIRSGRRPLAAVYDTDRALSDVPRSLELELSNLCNLACTMCNGELSSRIRHEREHRPPLDVPYDESFLGHFDEVLPGLDALRLSGGEPMLHQLTYRVSDLVVTSRPDLRIDISTNGTIANERVWRLLERAHVQLNVSFDSLDERCYESIRVGASFATMMANVEAFIAHFTTHPGQVTVNVNPMRMNWHEMPEFVRWCDERGLYLSFNEVLTPSELSLRTLPAAELRGVHDALAAHQAQPNRTTDGPTAHNRRQFDELARRIGQWADEADVRPSTETRVPAPRRRPADAAAIDRVTVHEDDEVACRAPFTSLFLDQHGDARACCQSTLVLGKVGEQTLDEIWTGQPAERLRRAMTEGDLSQGCEHCAWAVRHGDAEQAFARRFDHLPLGEPVGPVQLELALSNTCNLSCVMCTGDFSSSIRSQIEHRPPLPAAYGEDFFAQLEGLLPNIRHIEFFGGEPFLSREAIRVMERLPTLDHEVSVRATTNGTIWNARVQDLVRRLRMSLAVSIDGATPATFERIRVGASWPAVRQHLDEMVALSHETGGTLALAFCLMVDNWREFPDILRLGVELSAPVWVNTVLAPTSSSLYRLPVGHLHSVNSELSSNDDEMASLPEPWRSTWVRERRRLMDAAADNLDDEWLGSVRVIEYEVDEQLRALSVELLRDAPDLPPIDLPTAKTSADVRFLEPLNLPLHPWDGERVVHTRSYDLDGAPILERRTARRTPSAQGLGGSIWVTVEQRRQPAGPDLVQRLHHEVPGQPVVTIVLDDDAVVRDVLPDAETARRLGLEIRPGEALRSAIDALAPEHRRASPRVRERFTDPLTRRIEVACDTGLELLAFARRSRASADLHIFVTTRLALEPAPGAGAGRP